MPRESSWIAFLKGRDPNEPKEGPTVLLMGCRPFDPTIEPLDSGCKVCGGRIRDGHVKDEFGRDVYVESVDDVNVQCLQCSRAHPSVEAMLKEGRRLKPPPPPEPPSNSSPKPAGKKTRKQKRATNRKKARP